MAALASCLYEGVVRHRRKAPAHRLQVPLFMVYLDLGELDRIFAGRWLWSTRRPNLAWFRRADHLGDPQQPLDVAVRDLVERRTGSRPAGPVRLLTHLRYFGYCINPISLYFCHGIDERIECVVAEVHNTPWGERHCYVLQQPPAGEQRRMRHHTPKEFHVSPFMKMELDYRWTLTPPGKRFAAHIESLDGSSKRFDASLSLRRRPIDGPALAGVLLRYPWMTMRVLLSIYAHAARLWLKRARFHPHPKRLARSDAEAEG
jgi:DUF1365 family protein